MKDARLGWYREACVPLIIYGAMLFLAMFLTRDSPETAGVRLPNPTPCASVRDPLHPPMYPNAAQISYLASGSTDRSQVRYTISFHTADSPPAILNFYRDVMNKEGWTLRSQGLEAIETLRTSDTSSHEGMDPRKTPTDGIVGILDFWAFCDEEMSPSHPHHVFVVVSSHQVGPTMVELRIY